MDKLRNAKPKYCYNDIMIKPAVISTISHRSQCNAYTDEGTFPLFTAPMDTVLDETNYMEFSKYGIIPIIPRSVRFAERKKLMENGLWVAYSLDEFDEWFTDKNSRIYDKKLHVLIDIANGHMLKMYESVAKAKKLYGDDIVIMVGNIANPETYRICVDSGVDYVRAGIGGGKGCITSTNVAVHYSMASLISEMADLRDMLIKEKSCDPKKITKIVADGGVRNYSDIIKALALGADYVMCGSIFASMMESAATKVFEHGTNKSIRLRFPIERYENLRFDGNGWIGDYTDEFVENMKSKGHDGVEKNDHYIGKIKARFYGMASKSGQIAMKGKKVHTSEGIEKYLDVTTTIGSWAENFLDYLRSAMSYTGAKTLDEFRELSEVCVISNNTFNSINK